MARIGREDDPITITPDAPSPDVPHVVPDAEPVPEPAVEPALP